MLDHLESMRLRGKYIVEGSLASVSNIIPFACAHDAVHSVYKDKRCP